MKHKTYSVKRGDTLESISKELGISINELRGYHNRYCELYDLLGDKKISRNMRTILVPDLENKETTDGKKPLICSWSENSVYRINIQNSFYLKGESMGKNETESVWEIKEDKPSNSISLQVIDKKILNYDSQLKLLMDIISTINEASDYLQIQLNKEGAISSILNKGEIWEKWEEIKFEKIKQDELQDEYLKMLVEQYDIEFKNIEKNSIENILYQLLFIPVASIAYPLHSPRQLAQNRKVKSLIFPMQYIHYDLNYKSILEKNLVIVSVHSKLNENTPLRSLEEEYRKGYSPILTTPFSFEFKIEGKYVYNIETGKLNRALIYIKEKVSREAFYIARYQFTLQEIKTNNS